MVAIDTVKPTTIILIQIRSRAPKIRLTLIQRGPQQEFDISICGLQSTAKVEWRFFAQHGPGITRRTIPIKITDTLNHCESSANIRVAEDRQVPSL